MTEKELKTLFITNDIEKFNSIVEDNSWFYHQEFPVRTPDGKKYIDIVLKGTSKFYILEFKKNKIDTGVAEQLKRYVDNFDLQLYCKIKSQGIIVGKGFSKFELEMCELFNFKAMVYDGKYLEMI